MPLFDVAGWKAPNDPVATSKKRKRPSQPASAINEDEAETLRLATANVDRLMKQLAEEDARLNSVKGKKRRHEDSEGADDVETGVKPPKKGKKEKKATVKVETKTAKPSKELKQTTGSGDALPKKSKSKEAGRTDSQVTSPSSKKAAKQAKKRDQATVPSDAAKSKPAPPKQTLSKPDVPAGMTALQAKMKQKLDGARFRQINEELYKSDSAHAHQIMRDDPTIFHEYHVGFRHQVESWPTNPVSYYIDNLSSYPSRTVIADLGCGDAALARALVPKGLVVLSYDLVSDGAYVVEADTCATLPLPGSEGDDTKETSGGAAVVDVVVCALSLMGTNWPNMIREAWRTLKPGGELKIAEVASRFSDVNAFVALVSQFGFKLLKKDASNTHFTLFEFSKKTRKAGTRQKIEALLEKGDILKPCEYKRR